jgi:fructokinase
MTHDPYRVGIDLGGTKIEALLLDPTGQICQRRRIATPRGGARETQYQAIVDAVTDLIRTMGRHIPHASPHTIGIGIPGTLHGKTGLVQNANTTCLIGRPFQQDLETALQGRPVGMENDANCFALAEACSGAGQGHALVFGIIMGTGCGGGLSINGKIHSGGHRIAGEWGHFSVDPKGTICYCGNPGCVETKISGGGVENSYHATYGRRLTMKQITQGFREDDTGCRTIFEQFIDDYGRCVGGLISLLDPDAVILGGGLSNIDELYTLGLERVRRYAFHEGIETPIVKNHLGDSAGVFGAAWIGR